MSPAHSNHRFLWFFSIGLMLLSSAMLLITDPLPQDTRYHQLADQRSWLELPHFLNIISNLPFAVIGLAGFSLCRQKTSQLGTTSWLIFFIGLIFIAIGSSYYHLQPNNASLVWDRLPMTISFMSLLVALLVEFKISRLEKPLLVVFIFLGLTSVFYWYYSDDLRFYAFVQFGTLTSIPLILALGKSGHLRHRYLFYGLLLYSVAKVFEMNDRTVFIMTGQTISGHTIKHLFAAAATYCVYVTVRRRLSNERL